MMSVRPGDILYMTSFQHITENARYSYKAGDKKKAFMFLLLGLRAKDQIDKPPPVIEIMEAFGWKPSKELRALLEKEAKEYG